MGACLDDALSAGGEIREAAREQTVRSAPSGSQSRRSPSRVLEALRAVEGGLPGSGVAIDGLTELIPQPVHAGALITRDNWPKSPDGRRRVIREWQEVPRRISDGSYREAVKSGGAWR